MRGAAPAIKLSRAPATRKRDRGCAGTSRGSAIARPRSPPRSPRQNTGPGWGSLRARRSRRGAAAQVDARIPAQAQDPIDALGAALDAVAFGRLQSSGGHADQADLFLVRVVPLDLGCGDRCRGLGQVLEREFPHGKCDLALVAAAVVIRTGHAQRRHGLLAPLDTRGRF